MSSGRGGGGGRFVRCITLYCFAALLSPHKTNHTNRIIPMVEITAVLTNRIAANSNLLLPRYHRGGYAMS